MSKITDENMKNAIDSILERPFYMSETSKCRERLAQYCTGSGLDIGAGGDPILPSSIIVDLQEPYAYVGDNPVQISGDASNMFWFADNVLDYIYSSHLLEDFEDTEAVLREWLRVLKVNGRMIIYCPDEQVYRQVCKDTGQPYNSHHKHDNFSLLFIKEIFEKIGRVKIIHENPLVDGYSWEIVVEKQ
jgi:predicted SAM-dependent methyltransferase